MKLLQVTQLKMLTNSHAKRVGAWHCVVEFASNFQWGNVWKDFHQKNANDRSVALASFHAFATVRFPALIWALRSNRWCQRFLPRRWTALKLKKTFPWRPRSAQCAQWFLRPPPFQPHFPSSFPLYRSHSKADAAHLDLRPCTQSIVYSRGFGEGRAHFLGSSELPELKGEQHDDDSGSKCPINVSIWLGSDTDTDIFLSRYSSKQESYSCLPHQCTNQIFLSNRPFVFS